MDALYQILTFVFGGTSVVGTILSVIWWKQTKRLKEAEVKQKEAEADKTQADAVVCRSLGGLLSRIYAIFATCPNTFCRLAKCRCVRLSTLARARILQMA